MQLRKATIEDVESVVRILTSSRLEYLPYAKSPHSVEQIQLWVRNTLIPTDEVVIGELSGSDVAILATSVSDKIGWINQLYVAPGYLRQGIGTSLLVHALGILPRPTRLWTFQQNERAIAFYQHHGFKAIEYTNGENNQEKCPDVLFETVI